MQAHPCLPRPQHLTWEKSAAYMLVGATAYRMLYGWGVPSLRNGDAVLVWGGAGGLRSMAIQIVRAAGGRAVTVVSADDKFEYCTNLGVAGCINRRNFDHWGILPHWKNSVVYSQWLKGVRQFGKAIRVTCTPDTPIPEAFSLMTPGLVSCTALTDDNEGNTTSDSDDETVTVTNVAPVLTVVKEGPASIDEGGNNATYQVTLSNDSASTDPLTITSLSDDQFGDLLAEAEEDWVAAGNTAPIVLQPGESFTFDFTRPVTRNVGDTFTYEVTACGVDDEDTQDCDSDDHDLAFDNVDPVIAVTKSADQRQVFDPGEDVTFTIVVANNSVSTDPVTITSLVDDIHGDLNGQGSCTVPQTIQPGGNYTCSFTVLVDGDETDTVTASGSYTEDAGHTRTDTATDASSYYGLIPGAATNSSLCDFGDQFRLIFTPDMQRYSSSTPYYKLSDSNPGQFFYNLFQVNDGSVETFTLEIPYPFVTQGAMPVHVYDGVYAHQEGTYTCFDPTTGLAYGFTITLADYTDTNGDGKVGFGDVVLVNVPAEDGFQYINIHLDYGLEKTNGWLKRGSNVNNDPLVNPNLTGINILDNTAHTFQASAGGTSIDGSTDTIYNLNEFKQIRGFGGLVYYQTGEDSDGNPVYAPLQNAEVELWKVGGTRPIETMPTDADGWYLSNYIHKGKAATYTLRLLEGTLPSGGWYDSQQVTVGGVAKYGEGNFLIPQP